MQQFIVIFVIESWVRHTQLH